MADVIGRYPLSTADSQAVPLDVIRPESLVILPITHNSSSSAQSLPTDVDVFSFHASVQCLVQFAASNANAVHPDNYTVYNNALCCPAGMVILVSPPIGMRSIAVRSTQGNGQLVVQALQTWSGLALKDQFLRR